MPRKQLIYTHELPYHITARTNNSEWFNIPIHRVWKIFTRELAYLNRNFGFRVHAFVLMNNHYHLMASCDRNHNLGYVMGVFQSRTARRINSVSGRLNHVYGKRYRASLIGDPFYYASALKYVYRNPITAGICKDACDWDFSTVRSIFDPNYNEIPVSCHRFEAALLKFERHPIKWINQSFVVEDYSKIKQGLTRSEFKLRGRHKALATYL